MNKTDFYFFAFTFVGIIASVGGIIIIIYSILAFWQAKKSTNWSSTKGTIIDTKIVQRNTPRFSGLAIYDTTIEYQYSVFGVTYTGDKQSIGYQRGSFKKIDLAEQHVDNYKQGEEIIIHYDSSDPKQCTLIKGIDKNHYSQIIMGFVILLFGVAELYLMFEASKL